MEKTTYYIYKHTSHTSNKSYIGVTCDPKVRWNSHCSSARRGSPLHFHRAIRKYGEDDWETEIIFKCVSEEEAYAKEGQLIQLHETIIKGYNMSEGGKRTPTLRGEAHPGYGKKRSKETRDKISKNHYDCSGRNNSSAKHIVLQDPDGNIFHTHGTLKEFCISNKLGYSTARRQLKQNIKPLSGSFVGWNIWIES